MRKTGVGLAAFGSAFLHAALAVGLLYAAARPRAPSVEPVRVKIVAPPAKSPVAPRPPPEARKPEPPNLTKKPASERKPVVKAPAATVKPVQGLRASAFSPDGRGIAAPVGNTLNTADDGIRLKPKDVQALTDEDLSADAALIRTSVEAPQFTDAALDAGLEGTYGVEVFVDPTGAVTDAQLPEKIGYEMDARVLDAARKAHFTPRKDRYGKPIAGWTELKFRLEIPR
jgi:TonB family protein